MESLFNNVAGLTSCNYKETPTQVFSYGICEIFKNTYFEEHLRVVASDIIKARYNIKGNFITMNENGSNINIAVQC